MPSSRLLKKIVIEFNTLVTYLEQYIANAGQNCETVKAQKSAIYQWAIICWKQFIFVFRLLSLQFILIA